MMHRHLICRRLMHNHLIGDQACRHLRKCIFATLAMLVIFEVVTGYAMSSADLQQVAQESGPSVVMVTSYRNNGSAVAQGSGFFVSEGGDVITCYHLIEGADSAYVMTADGAVYPIEGITEEDRAADLVRLSVNLSQNSSALPDDVSYLALNTALPKADQEVVVLGPQTNLGRQVLEANVSAVVLDESLEDVILIDKAISPELSGAPVLSENGGVIGIAGTRMEDGHSLSFVIPAGRIFGGLWQSLISSRDKWRQSSRPAA